MCNGSDILSIGGGFIYKFGKIPYSFSQVCNIILCYSQFRAEIVTTSAMIKMMILPKSTGCQQLC